MNGAASVFSVYHTPEGREYYYNNENKQTQWVKPDVLLTPAQVATGWSITTSPEGKTYWFNKSDRNQTSWNAPEGWNTEAPKNDSSE